LLVLARRDAWRLGLKDMWRWLDQDSKLQRVPVLFDGPGLKCKITSDLSLGKLQDHSR
jgi:hypothetical protein